MILERTSGLFLNYLTAVFFYDTYSFFLSLLNYFRFSGSNCSRGLCHATLSQTIMGSEGLRDAHMSLLSLVNTIQLFQFRLFLPFLLY